MARAFQNGDFRSGYYRDQTFMMALGHLNPESFFHGLYATTDITKDPMSAGRQMGGHFMTHSINEDGTWKNLTLQKNSSADISCTAGQMPRLLGLAQASKVYRKVSGIDASNFSNNGNEVAWGTIGNASTSEGHFFEAFNAAGVLQVPMVISVWDDDYGISVPAKYHTTKCDISEILKGFKRDKENKGYEIIKVQGWDYTALIHAYENASDIARDEHVPVLIHVTELTQPQGHSTSGSHERYKSQERLEWERENDCNKRFREWILDKNIATEEELKALEKSIKQKVRNAKKTAWTQFLQPHISEKKNLVDLIGKVADKSPNRSFITKVKNDLIAIEEPIKKDLASQARKVLRYIIGEDSEEKKALQAWISKFMEEVQPVFSSHLYSELEGLQEKYGKYRIADTGIREATIIGQGIGLAMRGLRPIAEIQYLDYIMYGLQTLSDDLATLLYRTAGKQKAPLIVRTRGHRLEGIWHSGSQMGGLIHLLRGMYILTPRNMTQAAGFYNTLMKTDEPALVIESLNGYRLKEDKPTNLGEFCTPIGVVETLKKGTDITLLSYGSTLRIVQKVAEELKEVGIDAEVIDAQSLLPFDINHDVVQSLQKTNRLLIIDEDVPGGCSAYLLQEILEKQEGYKYLDSKPQTLTAKAHRPAYATDGDYFSKPNAEDIFEKVYEIMHEANPFEYPKLR